MSDVSTGTTETQNSPARVAAASENNEAFLAARAQFAARRGYKRALRRANNPLYFSLPSLALAVILALVCAMIVVALLYALRGAQAPAAPAAALELVELKPDRVDVKPRAETESTASPAVEVILAAERPQSLVLEGPPIPTVIITDTPVPLSVGVTAAVFGVGADKLNIRNRPGLTGSQILFRENEGKRFEIIGGPQEADGYIWWRVRDPQFQVQGWAVANYLRAVTENTGT
ncbi:MAG: hypothetical protein OXG85_11170 [Chloroflexi bacterium]|nr:hypothetical protein [Chloroflexota bacterium]